MPLNDIDPQSIAATWLEGFTTALTSGDASASAECFQPNGFLRDINTFTWNRRCLGGREKIADYLKTNNSPSAIRNIQLDTCPDLKPSISGADTSFVVPMGEAVTSGFTFDVEQVGPGQGFVFLAPAADAPVSGCTWQAVSVFMRLNNITGHEEWLCENGVYGGHTLAWTDIRRERRQAIEKTPHVVIIGAGQTGLNLAAQLTHMNIPTLVVETNQRVGDNWRKRYPTLSLHSAKAYSELLYQPFPTTWPIYAPRDKIADWLEQYASTQDLVVWTNSRPLPGPTYDTASRRWTIVIDRAGELVTLEPAHVIVCGALGAPFTPHVENKDIFAGVALHCVNYRGGAPFAGKRVVVVGAGNTSVDICQDLVFHGAQTVTMVQRSESSVSPVEAVRQATDELFPPHRTTDVSDLRLMAMPVPLIKRRYTANKPLILEAFKGLHSAVESAGFKLRTDDDIFTVFYSGYGGYWYDVGCAELMKNGQVRVKQGVELARFEREHVICTDGSSLEADVVIFATSFESMRDTMRGVFGHDIINQTSPVWGLDEEGELRGVYRPSGHPGLWFAAGEFFTARAYAKQLALQIKAIELGLLKL
ncbi:FAD/NAD-P-binding domain-containing protein [Mycena indigotica]|uniref:FAD/NAD-P-binding domain-containing protein n=1 Tax=Mycena indigotica TaxID=2126181 RepID=A0A8H6S956_9AGAR|nr:FAD/NAD-P-binding domain-containing protein [Mycena indigotica]KAF7294667.1 FAD/NAD-P-binding domain-containing protein [Mycena indigotica]